MKYIAQIIVEIAVEADTEAEAWQKAETDVVASTMHLSAVRTEVISAARLTNFPISWQPKKPWYKEVMKYTIQIIVESTVFANSEDEARKVAEKWQKNIGERPEYQRGASQMLADGTLKVIPTHW